MMFSVNDCSVVLCRDAFSIFSDIFDANRFICSVVLLGYIRLVKYKLCVWLHWDIPPDQKINTTREVHTHLILGVIEGYIYVLVLCYYSA
jgi:heme/copper-type cytochrome/quinol oxidase subunit 4